MFPIIDPINRRLLLAGRKLLAALLLLSMLLPSLTALTPGQAKMPAAAELTASGQAPKGGSAAFSQHGEAGPSSSSLANRLLGEKTGLTELVERRTAYSATFKSGSGYQTVISEQPLHYLDEEGQWQVIDPAFRSLSDSYVVEHNAPRSRAGAQRAWLSAVVGDTGLVWQATTLGVVSSGEIFTPLAQASDDPQTYAEPRAGNRALRYQKGWSNPTISEAILSAPGSIEHELILGAQPEYDRPAKYLELQATLNLLPGASLWAEGKLVEGPQRTSGSVEVRDAQGRVAMIFEPARAYEQAHPEVSVSGEYILSPAAQAGVWQVGVRTPWEWWAAERRAYPAVIDPLITVQRSTGFAEGLAWVRSTGDKAYTLGNVQLGAHLPDYNTESRGYMQFNSLPALLSNAPIKVKTAYLDVEPDGLWIPEYHYKGKGFTDWDSVPLKRKATLAYIGACPNDPNCNSFSLQDNRLADPAKYNWDNQPAPAVTYAAQTLTVGPFSDAGNANPTVTTWEVTSEIRSWYNAWHDKQNPRPGPVFQLYFSDTCPKPGPYISGFVQGKPQFDSNLVPQCTWFGISPGKISLRIEYDELPLSLGSNTLNKPGVPSYAPLPGSTENLFLNPNHRYKLNAPSGSPFWRAVALRGNHDYAMAQPTWATLKLLDFSNVVTSSDEPVELISPKAQGADQTTFFFIDDHLPGGIHDPTNDLRVEVVATADNDFGSDQGRNYRLNYVQATLGSSLTYGNTNLFPFTIFSDNLIKLVEFDLVQGDNVGITATVPISLEVALITPATGSGKEDAILSANHGNVNYFSQPASGSQVRTLTISAPVTGRYALAVINKEPPTSTLRPGYPDPLTVYFSILPCKSGTYPTQKHKCQPLILPDGITPAPKTVPVPGGGSLQVYSEGGFTAGSDWCTTNETAGAPVVGPSVAGRWVTVVQGSLCYQGGALVTTADSAVSLMVALPYLDPNDSRQHGQIKPVPIYGDNMLLPQAGDPDGEVSLQTGGLFQPKLDTLRRIAPFGPFGNQKYWQDNYTHGSDYLSTADMKAHASGQVATEVTVDAAGAPLPMDWQVAWELYPTAACPTCPAEYEFIDDPATPAAPFPLVMDLASTQLRMLNNDVLDGLVLELDSYLSVSGPRAFQFHNTTSRLTLDALLGGTTKPVQAVVQPPGWPRAAEGAGSCSSNNLPTSCLDLRRMEYTWQPYGDAEQNVQPWSLPDIHIETTPGMVAFSQPGALSIFSADHPAASSAFSQSFSFDTWDAAVHVAQEKCLASDPVESTVIRGKGFIALPTIGNDGSGNPDTWIKVDFKLCESQLQTAHLQFDTDPPGIIVGSTGFKVTLLDGTVTIDPNTGNVHIELGVGFQTLDNFTLIKGKGTVAIDTQGLLSLQATGKLVGGVVNAKTLRLDVAWNPLDLLFKGEVAYGGDLLVGSVGMHGWIGRGWQGKYSWLPDDDSFHFTGSIEATVRIPQGELIDETVFKLPPFTISISAKVAFGEFCTNASCTSYDWGMSATVEVLGYDVGVYVDSSGPDLILGTSSHKLIDQAGAGPKASQTATAQEAVWQPSAPAQPASNPVTYFPGINQLLLTPAYHSTLDSVPVEKASAACQGTTTSTHICSFTVNPGTGRALFSLSWENGGLDVALIKPDSTVITATNALANGVLYTSTLGTLYHLVAFTVITPTTGMAIDSGTWSVRIGNVGQGIPPWLPGNNYKLAFAADPPAATLEWSAPQYLSPTQARLTWTPSRGGQPLNPDLQMELFYLPVSQKPITPTLMAGTLIAHKVSATGGVYDWNLGGLASGEYAFGARLDDHQTGNGHVVVWSPFTVTYTDTTPPPDPVVFGTTAYTDTLLVHWYRDQSTLDLAGYLVEYTVPEWDLTTPLPQVRRVLPSLRNAKYAFDLFEHVRLGGLVLSQSKVIQTTVCVRAYDASGNVSGCTPIDVSMPEAPEPRMRPPSRISLATNGSVIFVNWQAPGVRDVGGYLVGYSPAGCLLPRASRVASEGASPLLYRPTIFDTTLSGLTVGQVYEVAVRAYNSHGDVSPAVSDRIMLIDPTDGNADGLPDQWANLYQLSDPGADSDGDGLSDQEEYQHASHPRNADSDGDGAYDGDEAAAGSDPCDPADLPQQEKPKLALSGHASLFFEAATNLNPAEAQFVQIFNLGGGTLNWEAQATQPWIVLNQNRGSGIGSLVVSVNPAGLAPGNYTGMLTITSLPVLSGGAVSNAQPAVTSALPEAVDIPINLLVLPLKEIKMLLPLVSR